jgi:hypothetical protein
MGDNVGWAAGREWHDLGNRVSGILGLRESAVGKDREANRQVSQDQNARAIKRPHPIANGERHDARVSAGTTESHSIFGQNNGCRARVNLAGQVLINREESLTGSISISRSSVERTTSVRERTVFRSGSNHPVLAGLERAAPR